MTCAFLNASHGVDLVQGGTVQTRWYDGTTYPAQRCVKCGHVFFPPPPVDELNRHYQEAYPDAASSWYNVAADYAPAKVTCRAGRVVAIASRFGFGQAHHFHEVGCAFGGCVHELNRLGYRATGTELNANAVKEGNARGNNAISSEEEIAYFERTGQRPHVVYGYHVLEHMTDPAAWLRDLAPCLAPDSIVVMFVPNAMALFPTTYGFERFIWFAFPEHLNLFSPRSALCLAQSAGYEIIGIETNPSNLTPEATARSLGEFPGTPVSRVVRDRLVTAGSMDEELVIVLARPDSLALTRDPGALAAAKLRCLANETIEAALRLAGETALSDPAVDDAPDEGETGQRPRDTPDPLQEAELRADRASAALRAIQQSTFWRITAAPRRIIDRLKGRG